jgi:RNA polymerase sigma-70 factor (ECF subfamily)
MHAQATSSFNELFLRHQRDVYSFIVTMVPDRNDAEDVFQQTCLMLLEKAEEFDPERRFFPWACGFALNEVRRFRRAHHRERSPLDDAAIDSLADVQQKAAEQIDGRLDSLKDCLAALPSEKRDLLAKSYGCVGGGLKAVATQLKLDVNTLYKRLERIRRILFVCMEKRGAR